MAWRPIAQSGVPFTFLGGDAEISGSTVTAPFSVTPDWEIQLDEGAADYSIRVTMQAYQSTMQFEEEPSAFTFTTVGDVETVVTNLNVGTTSAFSPNPVGGTGYRIVYTPGIGSETSRSESYTMLVEIEGADVCQEPGRTTRAFVSGYTLDRVQVVRAARTQRRCMVADFNGAIDKNRQIARATWRCNSPWITILDTPTISTNGRAAQVNATLGNCGAGHVKCSVELDNGEIYTQVFEVRVVDAPYFAEPNQAPGPYELSVTA